MIPICTIYTIFPMHTNTSEYVQIHTNTYHTYQCLPKKRSVLSNTYQYRHIQTNTYQYLQNISLLTNTDKYRPVHTIHTNTYHTSNTDQYRSVNANTYKYILIHINTYKCLPGSYQYRSA